MSYQPPGGKDVPPQEGENEPGAGAPREEGEGGSPELGESDEPDAGAPRPEGAPREEGVPREEGEGGPPELGESDEPDDNGLVEIVDLEEIDELERLDELGIGAQRKEGQLEKEDVPAPEGAVDELQEEGIPEEGIPDGTRDKIQKIAVALDDNVNNLIKELGNPAKGSRGEKQLDALLQCRDELRPYAKQNAVSKASDLVKTAVKLNNVVKKMELRFENIGYPGKLKVFLEAAKNQCTKLLNSLRGRKIEVTKSLTKDDMTHITKLATPITSAFGNFKNHIKQDVKKPEKPRPPPGERPNR